MSATMFLNFVHRKLIFVNYLEWNIIKNNFNWAYRLFSILKLLNRNSSSVIIFLLKDDKTWGSKNRNYTRCYIIETRSVRVFPTINDILGEKFVNSFHFKNTLYVAPSQLTSSFYSPNPSHSYFILIFSIRPSLLYPFHSLSILPSLIYPHLLNPSQLTWSFHSLNPSHALFIFPSSRPGLLCPFHQLWILPSLNFILSSSQSVPCLLYPFIISLRPTYFILISSNRSFLTLSFHPLNPSLAYFILLSFQSVPAYFILIFSILSSLLDPFILSILPMLTLSFDPFNTS